MPKVRSLFSGIRKGTLELKWLIVDGRGKIVLDSFAETRVLSLPRGVIDVSLFSHFRATSNETTQLLVMFNRNHNYIADMLLQINERDKWTTGLDASSPAKIFNTAHANVVLGDDPAAILGTVRSVPHHLDWMLTCDIITCLQ